MTTRISSFAQYQLTQSQMAQTQQRLQDLQVQLSSGMKAQRYSGLSPDASQLINLESTLQRTDQYTSGNNTVNLRLQTMETSVSSAFDTASSLKTLLVNALNGTNAGDLALNQTAQNMMDQLQQTLNAKIGDRYLFSGTATDTPPVDFSDPSFTAPPGVYPSSADTSYYQGDSTKLSSRIADNYDLTWGVTANEPGFEELSRALHLTATASTSPTDTNRLQDALSVVNQAISDLPDIRSRIGSAQKSIDDANTQHTDVTTYLNQSISDIKAVDIPSAMTQLSSEQTLLEASYSTVSRLSQLNLASFLH